MDKILTLKSIRYAAKRLETKRLEDYNQSDIHEIKKAIRIIDESDRKYLLKQKSKGYCHCYRCEKARSQI